MLRLLSVGHLLLINVDDDDDDDDEGCMFWAQHLIVDVAAAQLSLSMLMSGSSLYCLNLMTNDEPEGGLVMTTAGVLPNQDVVVHGRAVAEDDVAGAVVSSCCVVDVVAPHPPAPAVSMMAAVVSIDHLGWRWSVVVKNS